MTCPKFINRPMAVLAIIIGIVAAMTSSHTRPDTPAPADASQPRLR